MHAAKKQFMRKRRFLYEPHSVTSQKTASFIVTAVETSNLTSVLMAYRIGGLRGVFNNVRAKATDIVWPTQRSGSGITC
jgi:hypothetical protein